MICHPHPALQFPTTSMTTGREPPLITRLVGFLQLVSAAGGGGGGSWAAARRAKEITRHDTTCIWDIVLGHQHDVFPMGVMRVEANRRKAVRLGSPRQGVHLRIESKTPSGDGVELFEFRATGREVASARSRSSDLIANCLLASPGATSFTTAVCHADDDARFGGGKSAPFEGNF